MQSINATLLQYLRQGTVKPCVLLKLEVYSSTYYRFCDVPISAAMYAARGEHSPSIVSVSTIAHTMDIIGHTASVDDIEVTLLLDTQVRTMMSTYGLLGANATLELHAADATVTDTAPLFFGQVTAVSAGETDVSLIISSPSRMLYDLTQATLTSSAPGHPLERISDIVATTTLVTPSGCVPASTYDASTTSHWCCDLAPYATVKVADTDEIDLHAKQDPLPVLQQLLTAVDGALVTTESGGLAVVRYQPSASSQRDWTANDYWDAQVIELYEQQISQCTVLSHKGEDGNWQRATTWSDADAHLRYTAGAITRPYRTRTIELGLGLGQCYLDGPTSASAPAANGTLTATGDNVSSLCGTNWDQVTQFTQASWQQASASKLVYLSVNYSRPTTEAPECITVKAVVPVQTVQASVTIENGFVASVIPTVARATLTVDARAQLGSTAAAKVEFQPRRRGKHGDALSYSNQIEVPALAMDITIPRALAERTVTRFADGCPIIELRTNLGQLDVQLGDVVTVTWPAFVWYGVDGATTALKWQVVGKEVDLHADEPSIKWRLAFNARTVGPSTDTDSTTLALRMRRLVANVTGQVTSTSIIQAYWVSGGDITYEYGATTFSTSSGTIALGNLTAAIPAVTYSSLAASTDYYVYADCQNGSLIRASVTAAAAEPTREVTWVPAAMVRTDASGFISLVTDMRSESAANPLLVEVDVQSVGDQVIYPAHQATGTPPAGGAVNGDIEGWQYDPDLQPPDDFTPVSINTISSDPYRWVALDRLYGDPATTGRPCYRGEANESLSGGYSLIIAPVTPSVVGGESFSASDYSTAYTHTMVMTPSEGNCLVLCAALGGANTIARITQDGATWRLLERRSNTAVAEIWQTGVETTLGTSIVVYFTATTPPTTGATFRLMELSGVARPDDEDKTVTSDASGTSTTPSVTTTTLNWDDTVAIVCMAALDTVTYSSPSAGYTLHSQATSSGTSKVSIGVLNRLTDTISTAYTGSATISASKAWAAAQALLPSLAYPGWQLRKVPCRGSGLYEIEVDMYTDDTTVVGGLPLAYIAVDWYDQDGTTPSSTEYDDDSVNSWPVAINTLYRHRMVTESPSDARYAHVRIQRPINHPGKLWVDRVRMHEIAPTFSVYRSGSNQTGVATSTATTVQFATENYDLGSDYDTSTYTLTVPYDSDWQLEAAVTISQLGAAAKAYASIYKNGSEYRRGGLVTNGTAGAADVTCIVSTASARFSLGDAITVKIWHDHGSNRDVLLGSALTTFSGRAKL